ncbi:MAG TPA: hypothetical protein GX400_16540 [Chloroflexi bacterium]|nr:hypothetical protein [Chloroflexota bacterium]
MKSGTAHRSHLYQRLVIAGWRHRTVTLLYLGLALLGVALALAWVGGLPGGGLAAALLPPLCALLLWWGVGRAAETPSLSGSESAQPIHALALVQTVGAGNVLYKSGGSRTETSSLFPDNSGIVSADGIMR